jgi:hypothetical protein
MTWVGFELKIPVFELVKTVHTLDRAATVIGCYTISLRSRISEEKFRKNVLQ